MSIRILLDREVNILGSIDRETTKDLDRDEKEDLQISVSRVRLINRK